ncbi:polysaccharide deacetylase family protein [Bacillus sp. JJ1764]|uniref:polysaccharide deacetylase family protein n=1 Tax=Bacillus sp. JJ1764 TaxID=3122964 RepID=UPI002FFF941F
MTKILILVGLILFTTFIILAVISFIKKTGMRWFYSILSAICLASVLYTLFYFDVGPNDKNHANPENPPKTEAPGPSPGEHKPDPGGQEPPEETPPPKDDPMIPPPSDTDKIIISSDQVVKYTVVKGDTLWSIAKRANLTVDKIKQWNNLKSDAIYAGQILLLYGKNAEPPVTTPPPKEDPPPATVSSKLIYNGNSKQKEIALTFDAGSDAAGISILDILGKYNIKATFFLTGKWVEKFPEYAKKIVADGHEIGNHTYSHPDAVKTTSEAFKADIIKAEQIIKNITGKTPRPYFRFPYGSFNDAALKTVGEAGYPYSIQWSIDTIDWRQPSVEEIVSRIEEGASNGDIILMHIGGIHTPEAVNKIIPILQEKGYKIVTLTEVLN